MPDKAYDVLAGTWVVEVGTDVGLRYAGRLLAAFGARVTATRGPSAASDGFEVWLDHGKHQATLDDALAELRGVVPARRIVLVGHDPETVLAMDRRLAAEQLDGLRLGLTWFGMDGPYRDWTGDDALIHALIGLAAGFGPAESPPTLPQGHAPQIVGGATLIIAALAGLWARMRGTGPSRIDVNILEAMLCLTETSVSTFDHGGGRPCRVGVNRFSASHPLSVYRTADGWLGVTALTPAQWRSLATLVGQPAWADDPRFATSLDRARHADLIDDALNAVLATRTTLAWLEKGQRARIPLAPVPTQRELLATPHWQERASFAALPTDPPVLAPTMPFRIDWDGKGTDIPSHGAGGAPLNGLRIADFSMGWAGPLCTRTLADLGADVIKIEGPSNYDWWRGWEPPGVADPPDYETKMAFAVMNRGKRGITLDLSSDTGRGRALAVVASADIAIENFAPGVMAKLGLAPEMLAAARPCLVTVSMGAFGARGPWRQFRAYGSTVEQASSLPQANGEAEWPPAIQHVAYGDPIAGLYAAIAALTGLHGRSVKGGAWIDLAQVECLFQLGADFIVEAQLSGDLPRTGSRSSHAAPRTVVPLADG